MGRRLFGVYILCALLTVLTAQIGIAQGNVVPVSYDMLNGGIGTYNYLDNTYNGSGDPAAAYTWLSGGLGQLTDGVLGASNVTANLGNGKAYEWVGWFRTDPVITFDFGNVIELWTIGIHSCSAGFGSGIVLFNNVKLSFSNDGVNFGGDINYAPTVAEREEVAASFKTVALNKEARYLRAEFTNEQNWTFLSEVQFTGIAPATETPEPGSLAAMISGLGALVAIKRRKR